MTSSRLLLIRNASAVVRHGSEEQASRVDFLRIGEAALLQKTQHASLRVFLETLTPMKQMIENAVPERIRSLEVQQMERAAGAENATDFGECFRFLIRG